MYTVYVRLVVLKRELSLFVQVTTAVFISSRFHSAVIIITRTIPIFTCTLYNC